MPFSKWKQWKVLTFKKWKRTNLVKKRAVKMKPYIQKVAICKLPPKIIKCNWQRQKKEWMNLNNSSWMIMKDRQPL